MLRSKRSICGTPIHPWSIRTFLAFAAGEGILLDLVILGRSGDGGGGDGSRLQISVVSMIPIRNCGRQEANDLFTRKDFMNITATTVNQCARDKTIYTVFDEVNTTADVLDLKQLITTGGQLMCGGSGRNICTPRFLFRWDTGEGHSQHPVFQRRFNRLNL